MMREVISKRKRQTALTFGMAVDSRKQTKRLMRPAVVGLLNSNHYTHKPFNW